MSSENVVWADYFPCIPIDGTQDHFCYSTEKKLPPWIESEFSKPLKYLLKGPNNYAFN